MISYFYKTEIEQLLGKILSSRSLNNMLTSSIEERLLNCPIILELEKSSMSFLFNKMPEEIFEETFGFEGKIEQINVKDLWVSKSYLDLFFEYHKSFSYIFTIIPLGTMYASFETLHTVGEDRLFSFYERKEKEKTLLSRLIKLRSLSISKLSILTNISYNTIEKYTRDNKYLYAACYENIYLLSKALDVDSKIFLSKLNLDILEERYDKSLTTYSNNDIIDNALFYSFLYNENMLAKKNYQYDKINRVFSSSSADFQIIELEKEEDVYLTIKKSKYNNIIVFDRNNEFDVSKLKHKEGANVYIISGKHYYKVIVNDVAIQKERDKQFDFIR